ncbi:MAG TPA: hypothetical protein VEL76_12255 [Gemmataceae bacterium]|nr:hypothetical protein [Gemmataceae bacterium]
MDTSNPQSEPLEITTAEATETTATTRDELPKQMYPTREEALAAVPANPPKNTRAFQITVKGEVKGWILATGYDPAISRAAQVLDGYTVSLGGKVAPVTKEAVAAKLAEFTDEELAAMGLSRKPQKGAKK